MSDWYQTWFNDDYLALYPHRDEADAAALVALIGRETGWGRGWTVLDVGCGPGRHARALESSGVRCIGLDLSMPLLRRARELSSAALIRADMRYLPVRAGSMDAALSLFTSFGYFTTDDEHLATLCGMAATLRPGGWLVLDFLNAPAVRVAVGAQGDAMTAGAGGARISKRVTADGRYVVKDIELASGVRHQERVRLYTRAELASLLAAAGITIRQVFGAYDGSAPGEAAPRAIFLGQAA